MQINSAVIALTGESGDGIISLGEILTRIFAKMGLNVLTFKTYPAEVRGGQCVFTINVQQDPILTQGDKYDILMCMDLASYELNKDRLKAYGIIIFNKDTTRVEHVKGSSYGIPLNTLTLNTDTKKEKNMLMLGVMTKLFGLDFKLVKEIVSEKWGKNKIILEKNLKALKAGWEWSTQYFNENDGYRFISIETSEKMLLTGNEALCLGAMTAGCRFFSGYPITPATEILEWFLKRMPKIDGVAIQTEDEMSAFGAALGASFSGIRAMTATSGPGFSLMTEFVNLAGAAEIPIVVIDVQRAGPSTGMPTKMDQADLYHASFGGSGESPRIVLAPTNVEDCYYQVIKAFNLADKYQLPVILLSDQSLSHRYEIVPALDPIRIPSVYPKHPTEEDLKRYQRYKLSESGVSPMSIPGMAGGEYVATGLERDEIGMPTYDPKTHELNMLRRMRKLERVAIEDAEFETYGSSDAKIGIISWGSTTGTVKEAIRLAALKGLKVASLHPKLLYPVPKKEILSWLLNKDKVIVVEVNRLAQYHHILQGELGISLHSLTKNTGLPFTSREILLKIEEVVNFAD